MSQRGDWIDEGGISIMLCIDEDVEYLITKQVTLRMIECVIFYVLVKGAILNFDDVDTILSECRFDDRSYVWYEIKSVWLEVGSHGWFGWEGSCL